MRNLLPIRILALALACAPAAGQVPAPPGACPQLRETPSAPAEILAMKNPLPAGTDLSEARGIYRGEGGRVSCVQCHGEKGDGKGPMSKVVDPRPRNFACGPTCDALPDGQLFWIIRNGSPGVSMPANARLTDEQVWKLVAYIRQFSVR